MEFKKILDKYGFLLLLIVSVFASYFQSLRAFFQQDEWLAFNRLIILKNSSFIEKILNIFTPTAGHYTPLNLFALYVAFSAFTINYLGYALLSLILHIVIVLLVYWLVKRLLSDNFLAFLAALLFGVLAATYQATSWVIADLGTHFATIGGLLSVIFFVKFIQEKRDKFLISSLVSLIISLLFKEITIALFLLLPAALIYFKNEKKEIRKTLTAFFATGFIFVLFRVLIFIEALKRPSVLTSVESAGGISFISGSLISNLIFMPINGFVQLFIPGNILADLGYFIAGLFSKDMVPEKGTTMYDLFIFNNIIPAFDLIFCLFVLFATFFICKRKRDLFKGRILISSILFFAANLLIFAISPERNTLGTIIDSRYLYFVAVSGVVFLITLLSLVFNKRIKILIAVLLLVLFNNFLLNRQLNDFVKVSRVRSDILQTLKSSHPKLPGKAVFYSESDKSFYGLAEDERILPFQSGFGQTLLVWYQTSEHFPLDFFKNRFLWEINDQGFRQSGGRGFGYFRDFNLMAKTIAAENISPYDVIGFSFNSATEEIKDKTPEVQGRLEGFLAKKSLIPQESFDVSASANREDSFFTKDGNRSSFWDSKLTYDKPQFFLIDLKKEHNIAEVNIDSYNNKNQNQVGYRVLLSKDQNDWQEVFSAERYTPDKNGMVALYFKPQNARYVKIEQIGFHPFASWVINEINIYEVQ